MQHLLQDNFIHHFTMYFLVLLLKPKLHVIIPKNWVFGIENHWEKFVNASLNKNQVFLCFYSEEQEALDDRQRPKVDFEPNFESSKNVIFPQTGCYEAKLIWFQSKSLSVMKSSIFVSK